MVLLPSLGNRSLAYRSLADPSLADPCNSYRIGTGLDRVGKGQRQSL
jgi:hypothetical protein